MTIFVPNLILNTSLISDFIRFSNKKLTVALSQISIKLFWAVFKFYSSLSFSKTRRIVLQPSSVFAEIFHLEKYRCLELTRKIVESALNFCVELMTLTPK